MIGEFIIYFFLFVYITTSCVTYLRLRSMKKDADSKGISTKKLTTYSIIILSIYWPSMLVVWSID